MPCATELKKGFSLTNLHSLYYHPSLREFGRRRHGCVQHSRKETIFSAGVLPEGACT
ncbi:hypothetical protein TENDBA_0736a [Treponema pallidum subsp. endemicum str. Bosnia A]|uniref:Uncharacterized protein n=1 Tax=Treponema pallidum subsp. endemicum str. Bosnia A TaxID=1155776 RepID=A0AAU8RMZ4_TREPL|nr:hypothetical protein TENDBA_0736a [Treponema pallidum subsp. endemicum str. Bosnia A]QBC41777.1 hypothetical protein TENDIB_0736a [Treponema pallidum subsp. endemicum]UPN52840.1 hypothetical protein TENDC279_0736a [Treponema pallidum subsp. endemicum]